MSREHFHEWVQSHQTDMAVAEAIRFLAINDEDMQRLWEDPTEDEIVMIWERATERGLIDDSLMSWGLETLARVAEGIVYDL